MVVHSPSRRTKHEEVRTEGRNSIDKMHNVFDRIYNKRDEEQEANEEAESKKRFEDNTAAPSTPATPASPGKIVPPSPVQSEQPVTPPPAPKKKILEYTPEEMRNRIIRVAQHQKKIATLMIPLTESLISQAVQRDRRAAEWSEKTFQEGQFKVSFRFLAVGVNLKRTCLKLLDMYSPHSSLAGRYPHEEILNMNKKAFFHMSLVLLTTLRAAPTSTWRPRTTTTSSSASTTCPSSPPSA